MPAALQSKLSAQACKAPLAFPCRLLTCPIVTSQTTRQPPKGLSLMQANTKLSGESEHSAGAAPVQLDLLFSQVLACRCHFYPEGKCEFGEGVPAVYIQFPVHHCDVQLVNAGDCRRCGLFVCSLRCRAEKQARHQGEIVCAGLLACHFPSALPSWRRSCWCGTCGRP